MTWIITFVLIAFFIYLVYNGVALSLFGVPKSLSMTYYLFEEKKKWSRIFFPIMMTSVVAMLLPAWLELSEGSPFQFTAFLAAAGILFVGAAPAFKSSSLENSVHMVSAVVAAIFALLWVILVSKMWLLIVIWLAFIAVLAFLSKSVKSSYIYWLETVAFMATFTSIIAHYVAF